MLGPTKRSTIGLAALGFALLSGLAWAQTPDPNSDTARAAARDPAAGEALFRAGRQLLLEGKLEEAYAKFEESYRLDPTAGALLNMGECRIHEGKTASAWALYQQAATLADVQGKPDTYELASQRQRELEPDLSYLTFHVSKPVPGLEVKRDSVVVGAAQFDVALPVDPGRHLITAQAPGYEPVQIAVAVHDKRDRQIVNVPSLKEKPVSQVASVAPRPVPDQPPPAQVQPSPGSPWPWVLGGVGAASLVVGTVSGILALHEDKYAHDHCPAQVNCGSDVLQAQGRRNTEGTLAEITIPVGLVTIAGAATWLLLTPRTTADSDARHVSFGTFTNGHGATCWMSGAF